PVRGWGFVVKPDSADIGMPSTPIPVDANHFEIASPSSRESEVYIHVRDQLRKQIPPRRLIADPTTLDSIAQTTSENTEILDGIIGAKEGSCLERHYRRRNKKASYKTSTDAVFCRDDSSRGGFAACARVDRRPADRGVEYRKGSSTRMVRKVVAVGAGQV